jgi:hypothetical protein
MWCNHMYIYIYCLYASTYPQGSNRCTQYLVWLSSILLVVQKFLSLRHPITNRWLSHTLLRGQSPYKSIILGEYLYPYYNPCIYIYIHNIYIHILYMYIHIYNPYWTHVSGVCPIIQRRLEGSSCLVWVWLPFSLGSLECLAEKSGANKEPRKLFFFF